MEKRAEADFNAEGAEVSGEEFAEGRAEIEKNPSTGSGWTSLSDVQIPSAGSGWTSFVGCPVRLARPKVMGEVYYKSICMSSYRRLHGRSNGVENVSNGGSVRSNW